MSASNQGLLSPSQVVGSLSVMVNPGLTSDGVTTTSDQYMGTRSHSWDTPEHWQSAFMNLGNLESDTAEVKLEKYFSLQRRQRSNEF